MLSERGQRVAFCMVMSLILVWICKWVIRADICTWLFCILHRKVFTDYSVLGRRVSFVKCLISKAITSAKRTVHNVGASFYVRFYPDCLFLVQPRLSILPQLFIFDICTWLFCILHRKLFTDYSVLGRRVSLVKCLISKAITSAKSTVHNVGASFYVRFYPDCLFLVQPRLSILPRLFIFGPTPCVDSTPTVNF
jgi:hypothetical protein